jgi:diguanylate cyclase (GGDEF)-like protein
MPTQDEPGERLGLQSRLRAELYKLEARHRDIRWLAVLAAVVLVLGAATLLTRGSFWYRDSIEIKLPPPLLFLIMMVAIFLLLYLIRRELEMRRLSLLALQQTATAHSEHSASMIDALTNVFSRRFLAELLQGEIARAERNQRPLALLMCDVDHFKAVNDRHGHLVGDQVLAEIAEILKSCVRGSDHVVRYGGDEFLLILSETDAAGAEAVRLRVREKVREWDRTQRPGEVPISLSLGIQIHVPGHSPEQDIAAADSLLYAEKQKVPASAKPTGD